MWVGSNNNTKKKHPHHSKGEWKSHRKGKFNPTRTEDGNHRAPKKICYVEFLCFAFFVSSFNKQNNEQRNLISSFIFIPCRKKKSIYSCSAIFYIILTSRASEYENMENSNVEAEHMSLWAFDFVSVRFFATNPPVRDVELNLHFAKKKRK